jgi:S1-C subfamily serine protease
MAKRRSVVGLCAVGASLALLAAPTAADAPETRLSYAHLVKAVAPAVVNIYTRRVVATRFRSPFFDDPFFERFFGRAFPDMPRERIENSLGMPTRSPWRSPTGASSRRA